MLEPTQIASNLPAIESIESAVDSGGQKSVFPCQIDGIKYALKVIDLPAAQNEHDQEIQDSVRLRAVRETEIMLRISNPHLVRPGPIPLTTFREDSDEYLCFSEEWIDGNDIAARVERGDLLTSEECWKLNREMIGVIGDLWNNRLLHRDISLRNIMIRENGDFVLIDLGYAFDFIGPSLTKQHGTPGSLHYLAPERFNLARKRYVDHRADQFSLGVVSYVGVTGRHPYYQNGMSADQYIDELCNGSALPIRPSDLVPTVNNDVENYVARLISRQPHSRFRSCNAALKQIDLSTQGE